MQSVQWTTNKCGPDLLFRRDISRKEFIEICEEISARFTDHFNRNGASDVPRIYKFEPEPISEGGLIMTAVFTGENGYKSMRIKIWNWPTIDSDTYEKWKNDANILYKADKNCKIGTYLKSYNTIGWTKKELSIIREVFALHDIRWTNYRTI
jgi:hypothetical protein